jgi:hypothetical protein
VAKRQRGRLLTVSPQVRILPLVQRREDLPAGRIGRSPPKAALGVRISPGRHIWSGTHLGSEAAVYRPRRVRFSSGPQRRQGIPTSRGRRLRPGVLQVQILSLARRRKRARSTTEVRPHDKRPTRGSTPPARTKRTGRPSGRSAALQAERRGFNSRSLHSLKQKHRAPSPTGRGSLLKSGLVGVRISGRALRRTSRRHSVTNR